MPDNQIDILMAVYNSAHYLQEQLQSVMDQTFQDFHLIIRDDCSLDNSLEIVEAFKKKYPSKITLHRAEKNSGALGNFSALASLAKAPYIMFCDGDDVWLPNKVADTFNLLKHNENLHGAATPILIHTDLKVVDKHLHVIDGSFWNYTQVKPQRDALKHLLVQNTVTGCTMMLNQGLLKLALPIPSEAIMHDWWIGLVAAAFGKIDFLPKSTILYRQHGKNEVGAKDAKSWKSRLELLKKALKKSGQVDLRQRVYRTITQAKAFWKQYEKTLSPKNRETVSAYLSLAQAGFFKKRYLLLRHGFFKNTLSKNIGLFMVI